MEIRAVAGKRLGEGLEGLQGMEGQTLGTWGLSPGSHECWRGWHSLVFLVPGSREDLQAGCRWQWGVQGEASCSILPAQ